MAILNTFVFGVGLDLQRVLKYLKKPVAPSIGVFSQFIVMPLVSTKVIFPSITSVYFYFHCSSHRTHYSQYE